MTSQWAAAVATRPDLAAERAALRKVATLVARESSPEELFAVVVEQVAEVFDIPHVALVRYEPDGSVVVGGFSVADHEPFRIGSRWPLDSPGVIDAVRQTGRPAQVDCEDANREIVGLARPWGMRSAVASPIVVERRLWGVMVTLMWEHQPLSEDTGAQLADFTELVATAIANAEARAEVERLAEEQAALRRVATLVAKEAAPAEVFAKVAQEAGALLGDVDCGLVRDVGNRTGSVVAAWGPAISSSFPIGTRVPLGDDGIVSSVLREGRPLRIDDYSALSSSIRDDALGHGLRSTVGCPVFVRDANWGALVVATTGAQRLGPETERRLEQFAELVATAIANADARGEVERLAAEQAALRHVATLVATGAASPEIFAAVSAEVARVFHLERAAFDVAGVVRFEPGPELAVVGVSRDSRRCRSDHVSRPTSSSHRPMSFARDARPVSARLTSSRPTPRSPTFLRHHGYLSQVASPIVVDGRLWGAVSVNSRDELPPDTEERLEKFTELVATAIANAESSAELVASPRRIVTASDEARRRIERDLHDGVQQQLVSLGLALGAMNADPPAGDVLRIELAKVTQDVCAVLDALVTTARGIHPAILTHGGLAAALSALTRRSAVPVELRAGIDGPLPDEVAVAAYYVAAEAMTNTVKHARASVIEMDVTTDDEILMLVVRDDGIGGAERGGGSGLIGLQDRVEALAGTIEIDSRPGIGTSVVVRLPIAIEPDPVR
jgi:signal transduction histidine kinase